MRIDTLQPQDFVTANWAEWEGLRCEVLARLRRHAQLLARVNALPATTMAAPLTACFVEAARAALLQNDPRLARTRAAGVLWQRSATPAQAKAVRAVVIESYVAERRGEDAFRSMLRFHQDYQPLDRALADRFAEALLDLGQEREALNWLGRADEVSAARLRLQLRAGTLSPEVKRVPTPAEQTVALQARTPARGQELRDALNSSLATMRSLETRNSGPQPQAAELVPIQELLYRGHRAIERAAEIRRALKKSGTAPTRALVDELVDLVELASVE